MYVEDLLKAMKETEPLKFRCEECGYRYEKLNLVVRDGFRHSLCDNCLKIEELNETIEEQNKEIEILNAALDRAANYIGVMEDLY